MFVDTVAPAAHGDSVGPPARRVDRRCGCHVPRRAAAGLAGSDASGVAAADVRWGDGTVTHAEARRATGSSTRYRRPGRYRITVTVDRPRRQPGPKVVRRAEDREAEAQAKAQRPAPGKRGARVMPCVAIVAVVDPAGARRVAGVAARPGPGVQRPRRRPTGALYSDGQSGRYLLGGTWLYRADTGDVGLAQGWWRDVASTDGWSPVDGPQRLQRRRFLARRA